MQFKHPCRLARKIPLTQTKMCTPGANTRKMHARHIERAAGDGGADKHFLFYSPLHIRLQAQWILLNKDKAKTSPDEEQMYM